MIVTALACMLFALNKQGNTAVEDQIAPALQAAGLTTASARFDPGMMALYRSAEFSTPLYEATSLNPWQAPLLFNVFTNDVDAQAGKPNEILNIGTHYVGNGSRRTLIGDPIATIRPDAKTDVDAELTKINKDNSGDAHIAGLDTAPTEVKRAALLILKAMGQAHEQYGLFHQSLAGPANEGDSRIFDAVTTGMKDDVNSTDFRAMLDIFERADTRYLIAGANDLLMAVQDAAQMIASVPPTVKYRVQFSANNGTVVLAGGDDSTYKNDEAHYCLIIDTGGNDTYINLPSAFGNRNWTSVVIDTNGNDKYLSDPVLANEDVASYKDRKNQGIAPGPAGAFMGYSFLFDLQGDDLYRSERDGLGSGRLGVAVLEDGGGNDVYDSYQDSIGFGMFGAGILEDRSGNDTYSGFQQVEGVGQTEGFGALIDHAGSDTYIANDTVIDFPSAQSAQHQNSMSQGAGNGTRRDYLDAHQLAGGIGLLLDDAGDDKYSCAVFGQGTGYLEGIGILRDKSGTDTYNGMWYVQGASAHFAVGYLQDDQGDDRYTATMNMAQGAGHDFGAGYLLDLAGNDTYVAPNLSLGAGNANGIGLLLDAAGDDSYTSTGLTLGQAGDSPKGTLRERSLCLGVFCDLGGHDKYPANFTWAKDSNTQINWQGKQRVPEESQVGVFYDK